MTMTFAGIKVAIGNAWATLVAAEMLAASSGLGYMILMGRSYGRVDLVILGIVVIGVLGVLISAAINLKILYWGGKSYEQIKICSPERYGEERAPSEHSL